jgi:hypothetical protein
MRIDDGVDDDDVVTLVDGGITEDVDNNDFIPPNTLFR